MQRLAILAVAALAAAVGSATAPAGPGRAPTAAVNVSRLTGNQSEATIGINPTNPDDIVVLSNLEVGDGMFKAYSTDGGATWTTDVIADGDNLGSACCDGQGVFDEFGNFFLTYLDASTTDVMLAKSVDGGATFSLVGTVRNGRGASPLAHPRGFVKGLAGVDQPSVAAAEGEVWVTYETGSQIEARGAQVTALGTVGAFVPAQVAPSSSNMNFGDIGIGPDGQVMVVYQNNDGDQGPDTVYGNLDADGLGAGGFGARFTVSATNVGDFDFIPPQNGRSVDAEANLAWDRSGGAHDGRVYMVYTDETVDESSDTDVYVRHSDNDGGTWSAPVKVNDDATTRAQFLPDVAVDQTSGQVAVTFHDARADGGDHTGGDTDGTPNDDAQYWGSFSVDGGATWRANEALSGGTTNAEAAGNGIDLGDYTTVDFVGHTFRAAWADNSNSTGDNPDGTLNGLDVYTAAVPTCVSLEILENGAGDVGSAPGPDCGADYLLGADVTLTATADPGSTFLGWSGDAGGTCTPLTVSLDGDRTVTGQFTNVAGFVDDRSPGVSYDAWTFGSQSSPCEGYASFAGTRKGTLRIATGSGGSVDVVLARGPGEGRVDIRVDGRTKAKLDLYDPDPLETFTQTVTGLRPGASHVVEIVARGKANTLSSGTEVRFYSLDIGTEHIEETSEQISVDRLVTVDFGAGNHGGSHHTLTASKATMTYSYSGDGTTLYYRCGPDTGVLRATIDGDRKHAVLVDTYQASATVCTVAVGPAGTHTVVLSPSGRKNTLSTGKAVGIDGYAVL